MNFAEALAFCALVIGIVSLAGVLMEGYKSRQSTRQKELESKVRIAEAGANRALPSGANYEERLRVLERIATDRGQMVADEIEALRIKQEKDKVEA